MNGFDTSPDRDDIAHPPDPAYATAAADGLKEGHATPSFPWPPAEGDSIVDAWGRTWHGASLTPRRFFSQMPRPGSLGAAVLYYLSIGIAVAGAQLFWAMVRGTGEAPVDARAGPVMPAAWRPLIDFLTAPVILLLSLFVAAGVTHLLLKLMGGTRSDNGGYGTTARVFAYAYSPQMLGIVPVVGVFAGFIWMVIAAIAGLREAHGTTTGRAAAAVLVPLTTGLVFVALAELIVRMGALLDLPM